MESWITLFTAHGKAKDPLSLILQTELPTIPKDSQLYTLRHNVDYYGISLFLYLLKHIFNFTEYRLAPILS